MTLTDESVWDRDSAADPPTFGPGDKVTVSRLTAQELVGAGRAEYIDKEPEAEAGPLTTADVTPAEDAAAAPPRTRKAAQE